jgi:hypothetical protein
MSADNGKSPAEFGPVAKLKMLAIAARNPKLSRVELAVLIAIADHANAQSGIAFPAFATLAAEAGSTRRHVKTCVKQLIAGGYLTIALRGNRVRSNRYKIILDPPGGALQNTTPHSDPQSTTVVLSSVTCGALKQPDVVLSTAPESFHPSEHKASDGCEGSQADGGALRAPALRPALAHQPNRGSDSFPEFWNVVTQRKQVAECERELRKKIAEGHKYADILEGVERWEAYNKATGGKNRATPLKWLQNEKWRDGWELPSARKKIQSDDAETAPKAKGEKAKAGKKKPAKARSSSPPSKKIAKEPAPVKKPRKLRHDPNPEYDSWSIRKKQHLEEGEEYSNRFSAHKQYCEQCNVSEANTRYDDFCDVGERLRDHEFSQYYLWKNFSISNPPPPQYITMIESEDGQWVPEER